MLKSRVGDITERQMGTATGLQNNWHAGLTGQDSIAETPVKDDCPHRKAALAAPPEDSAHGRLRQRPEQTDIWAVRLDSQRRGQSRSSTPPSAGAASQDHHEQPTNGCWAAQVWSPQLSPWSGHQDLVCLTKPKQFSPEGQPVTEPVCAHRGGKLQSPQKPEDV